MSKVDDLTRLKHIRDAAQEALSFTNNRTRNDLDTDRMLSLALVRLVEINGLLSFTHLHQQKFFYLALPST